MNPVLKTLVVIALRHVAPLIGGAGLFSDSEWEQIAGGLILLGSLAYHGYQRHQKKDVPEAEAMPMGLMQSQSSMLGSAPATTVTLPPSLAEQGNQMVRDIVTTKPNKVTVGGISDGKGGVLNISYDRHWTNGWGATAYFKAWRNAASVTPVRSSGMMVGGEGSYEFGKH